MPQALQERGRSPKPAGKSRLQLREAPSSPFLRGISTLFLPRPNPWMCPQPCVWVPSATSPTFPPVTRPCRWGVAGSSGHRVALLP